MREYNKEYNKKPDPRQRYFPTIGYKYFMLTVVDIIYPTKKGERLTYRCKCDCGNIKDIRPASQLYKGNSSTTKSCGCMGRVYRKGLGARMKKLKGSEGNPTEITLIASYKYSAKRRGVDFTLTKEQFHDFCISDCHYCGAKPSNISRFKGCSQTFTYNGIDRVDSSIGYIYENCVTCCITCNRAKNSMSLEEFKAWLERIYTHFIKNF